MCVSKHWLEYQHPASCMCVRLCVSNIFCKFVFCPYACVWVSLGLHKDMSICVYVGDNSFIKAETSPGFNVFMCVCVCLR